MDFIFLQQHWIVPQKTHFKIRETHSYLKQRIARLWRPDAHSRMWKSRSHWQSDNKETDFDLLIYGIEQIQFQYDAISLKTVGEYGNSRPDGKPGLHSQGSEKETIKVPAVSVAELEAEIGTSRAVRRAVSVPFLIWPSQCLPEKLWGTRKQLSELFDGKLADPTEGRHLPSHFVLPAWTRQPVIRWLFRTTHYSEDWEGYALVDTDGVENAIEFLMWAQMNCVCFTAQSNLNVFLEQKMPLISSSWTSDFIIMIT